MKIKEITNNKPLLKIAYQLRHETFCKQLGWVKKDKDKHDRGAFHFGIFTDNDNEMVGYFRLIPAYQQFTIEKEFSFLVMSPSSFKKPLGSVEISKLCWHKVLFKDIFYTIIEEFGMWMYQNGLRFVFFVTTKKIYELVSKKFSLVPIGQSLISDSFACYLDVYDDRNVDFFKMVNFKI